MEIIQLEQYKSKNLPEAKKKPTTRTYLRAHELADHFHVSRATVTRWMYLPENPLPFRKSGTSRGSAVIIDLDLAEEWYDKQSGGRK